MIIEFENLKGKSISLEGGEGSGKGTVKKGLENYFYKKNVLFTREPGGVAISEEIREILVDKKNVNISATTEMLLFAAARAQHLEEKVLPALECGKFVIFDRFVDSSYVYQGIGRGLGLEKVINVNNIATNGFLPNKTIILDIDPLIGLDRIMSNRQDEVNRLDLESIEFHQSVREGYLKLKEMFPDRISIVNANQTQEKVLEDVLREISSI